MKISGAGSVLTFPDGSTQSTAAGSGAAGAGVNFQQIALLQWFPVYQSASFTTGTNPDGVAFDGADIWVVNHGSNTVSKLAASTGQVLGTYSSQGSNPEAIAFDGANIWVTSGTGNTVAKLLASTGALVNTYSVGAIPTALHLTGPTSG